MSNGKNRVRNHVKNLYNLQGGRCYYCGTPDMYIRADVSKKYHRANRHFMATFDHIIAKSEGGTYKFTNGVCACSYCNSTRGNTKFSEFIEKFDVQMKLATVKLRDPDAPKRGRQPTRKQLQVDVRWDRKHFALAQLAMVLDVTVQEMYKAYIPQAFETPEEKAAKKRAREEQARINRKAHWNKHCIWVAWIADLVGCTVPDLMIVNDELIEW